MPNYSRLQETRSVAVSIVVISPKRLMTVWSSPFGTRRGMVIVNNLILIKILALIFIKRSNSFFNIETNSHNRSGSMATTKNSKNSSKVTAKKSTQD